MSLFTCGSVHQGLDLESVLVMNLEEGERFMCVWLLQQDNWTMTIFEYNYQNSFRFYFVI